MFRGRRSFTDRIRSFFAEAADAVRELSVLGQSYTLIVFRRNGQFIHRYNAGIAVLLLVIVDLIFPALVIFGLFLAFVMGVRVRFQRVY